MQNKKERKIYIPPEVVMLSEPAAYTDGLCSAGSDGFTPAGCQGGAGDSVYCLVGMSGCGGGSSASGGCGGGVTGF